MKPDPLGTPRDPFRVFILCWMVVNGLALAAGHSTSRTLEQQLPSATERLYGGLLGTSALLVLIGMYWPWDPRDGLVAKLGGFTGLTFGVGIFALATLATWDLGGVLVGGSGIAFAGITARSAWLAYRRLRPKDANRPLPPELS
jgi:hypothetical protein